MGGVSGAQASAAHLPSGGRGGDRRRHPFGHGTRNRTPALYRAGSRQVPVRHGQVPTSRPPAAQRGGGLEDRADLLGSLSGGPLAVRSQGGHRV